MNANFFLIVILSLVITASAQAQVSGAGGTYNSADKKEGKVALFNPTLLKNNNSTDSKTQSQFYKRQEQAIVNKKSKTKQVRWFRKE